ncbi:sulfatase [Algoriphagus sp. H41]|uniref:Sulfatase n=1 Tax=Algoriphagus oliviformis TaxID=2811231 RepID=A0ABS3C6F4_9BACT|nr:sulfatase [Algoriphagus oliviformis]MBN7811179.1 sulfatase [Algoriphagus oliviformis]
MKKFPFSGLCLGFWLLPLFSAFSQQEQPNILFIVVDDLGYHDLGVTGSSYYETPHVDRLAGKSYQFTQGYTSSPVCSPARASLMTGLTPARHGITDWIGAPEGEAWRDMGRHTKLLPPSYSHALDSELTTLPEALQEAGYETFFAGKWHLGSEGSYPEDHGFETNIGGFESGSPKGGYFAPYDNPKLKQGPDGENLSMRLANETAQFIEGDHERPFFAMLSFYAVHGPIQTTEEKWAKFRVKAEKNGIADQGFEMERRLPIRVEQDNPVYAGLVEAMDDAVGRVMEALDKAGLAENTVVVFTSDHGGVASGDNFSTSNLPLRGGKGYQWEGGLRVPYFIHLPGQDQGQELSIPATGIDIYPTLLALAGAKAPAEIEGIDLFAAGKRKKSAERDLFWHYPHYGNQGGDPSSIIRRGKWKLIHYWEDGRRELYDLEADPSEQKDIAAQEPKRVKEMDAVLLAYLKKHGANMAYADPAYDAEAERAYLQGVREKRWPALEKERKDMLSPTWQPNANWWKSKVSQD